MDLCFVSAAAKMYKFFTMKAILLSFFTLFVCTSMEAQDFSGKYNGSYNGSPVVLELKSEGNNHYSGNMSDGQQQYTVAVTASGNSLTGTCKATVLGFVFDLTGTLSEPKLSMVLGYMSSKINFELIHDIPEPAATKPQPKAPAARVRMPADADHDPVLTGRWVRETNYNSGYGRDGAMSTQEVLIFLENGQLADGGSQTVTSGSNWSGNSQAAGTGVVDGVLWYNKGNQLYLAVFKDGQTQQVPLGRYYVEGNHLLVTGSDGAKVLYTRG